MLFSECLIRVITYFRMKCDKLMLIMTHRHTHLKHIGLYILMQLSLSERAECT